MGASKDVFLPKPKDEENIRSGVYGEGELIALSADDFEVEYGGVEAEEKEYFFPSDPDSEEDQAPAVVSFDEMRHAISVVEDKNIDVSDASNGAVSAARKTFKLLEETALLAEMLRRQARNIGADRAADG